MNLVTGIDTLGAVTDLEVHTALEAGFPLQNRNTYILSYAGVDSGLEDNNGAFGQVGCC